MGRTNSVGMKFATEKALNDYMHGKGSGGYKCSRCGKPVRRLNVFGTYSKCMENDY